MKKMVGRKPMYAEVPKKPKKHMIQQSRIQNAKNLFNRYQSKRSRIADKAKRAKKTFRKPTTKQYHKWMRNTNRYDIQGVDTPKTVKVRASNRARGHRRRKPRRR